MARRLTVSIDETLETALKEAPELIGVPEDAADAKRLREYARIGYRHALEKELDEARLATYRAWADAPGMGVSARAASRRAAGRKAATKPDFKRFLREAPDFELLELTRRGDVTRRR